GRSSSGRRMAIPRRLPEPKPDPSDEHIHTLCSTPDFVPRTVFDDGSRDELKIQFPFRPTRLHHRDRFESRSIRIVPNALLRTRITAAGVRRYLAALLAFERLSRDGFEPFDQPVLF